MTMAHSKSSSWKCLPPLLLVGAGIGFATPEPVNAEPVRDQVLADHQVITNAGCTLIKIKFNIRIRYTSHFPLVRGEEVRIKLQPIDPAQAAAELTTRGELLRPPDARVAPIKAIEFEAGRADGPTLTIRFHKSVAYQVGPGADFASIVLAIPNSGANSAASAACKPEFPIGVDTPWSTSTQREQPQPGSLSMAPARQRNRVTGQISAADLKIAAASMDEARAALKKSDYPRAIRVLSKVLSLPENTHSAEVQELIGVVYQKNKQPGEARAEYEDYLQRYPNGDGAESVRQRLAAILTADMPREEKLRISKQAQADGQRGPGPTTSSVSGSLSQFYIRDDSFRVVRDPSLPPLLNSDKADHAVHRNLLLSSFDLFGVWGNSDYKSKFRFSGAEEHQFGTDAKDLYSVSALYLETSVKDWGTLARAGRQSRNTGGVLGRFDGGLVSWQSTPWMRLNVVGGSPVASRKDKPFKDEKVFAGTSVDFGPFAGGFDFSLFAIGQQAQGLVDRAAVGTEIRYRDANKTAFATIDYDVHFQQLNAAIFSGSLTLPDKSTLYGGIDHRKSPYLTSWNALQGQQYLTLFDLLKQRTKSEIEQMAIDRTATYSSATIGYTRSLTDKLQFNADVTAAQINGTIASFGVDATPASGNSMYYSTQLTGSSLFFNDDFYVVGARFSDLPDSRAYALDFSTRLSLTLDWRINPRLLLTYREGKGVEFTEVSALPSVLFNYYWTKDFSLELEAGAKWTRREQAGARNDDTELFVTAGFRYDFYADGKPRCASGTASC
jgi:tetratricopeptide (TPR) repeat protein